MDSRICNAIRERAVIAFDYNGGPRTVEPYCHGINKKGKEMLRGYQTGGYSKSGDPSGWRLFEVTKMVEIENTGEMFRENRTDYEPNDEAMIEIYCRI